MPCGSPGGRIVVGLSGGADSVCLALVLQALRSQLGMDLHMAHLHHGLRAEADGDEDFVRRLCQDQGWPLTLWKRDICQEAGQAGIGLEEAGRNARRRLFLELAGEGDRIALAHHANDQAETMLFHLVRGAGLLGLSGMAPRKGPWIRPLLCLERGEIEAYLEERSQAYCLDASNEQDDYTRNRIRRHILPLLQSMVNPEAVSSMSRAAGILRESEAYMDAQAQAWGSAACKERGGIWELDLDQIRPMEPVLGRKLLLSCLAKAAGAERDLAYVHGDILWRAAQKGANGLWSMPYGVEVRIVYGKMYLKKGGWKPAKGGKLWEMELDALGPEWLEVDMGESGRIRLCRRQNTDNTPYTKWFSCDKMEKSLALRRRREGDMLPIRGRDGQWEKQSLKKYFINAKIPRQEREAITLLASGSTVLWALGHRAAQMPEPEGGWWLGAAFLPGESQGGESSGRAYSGDVD